MMKLTILSTILLVSSLSYGYPFPSGNQGQLKNTILKKCRALNHLSKNPRKHCKRLAEILKKSESQFTDQEKEEMNRISKIISEDLKKVSKNVDKDFNIKEYSKQLEDRIKKENPDLVNPSTNKLKGDEILERYEEQVRKKIKDAQKKLDFSI